MGIYIDPELRKPLQCTYCASQKIAKMVNEGVIRCLGCGREKPDPNSLQKMLRREMGQRYANNVYTPVKNPHTYRPF